MGSREGGDGSGAGPQGGWSPWEAEGGGVSRWRGAEWGRPAGEGRPWGRGAAAKGSGQAGFRERAEGGAGGVSAPRGARRLLGSTLEPLIWQPRVTWMPGIPEPRAVARPPPPGRRPSHWDKGTAEPGAYSEAPGRPPPARLPSGPDWPLVSPWGPQEAAGKQKAGCPPLLSAGAEESQAALPCSLTPAEKKNHKSPREKNVSS